jgi:hypothetical protein
MSYSINNIAATPPTGSIMAYLGSTDPVGWVICDGVARTNADSRFNGLAAMGIGSGGAGTANFTPPDLRGYFLRGSNLGTTTASTTAPMSLAPTIKTTQTDTFKSHNHTVSDHTHTTGAHNHTITDPGHVHTVTMNSVDDKNFSSNANQNPSGDGSNSSNQTYSTNSATTGISLANTTVTVNSTALTISSTGDTNETRPYNYGVNWIVKI